METDKERTMDKHTQDSIDDATKAALETAALLTERSDVIENVYRLGVTNGRIIEMRARLAELEGAA